jgi:hypothetical protein
MFHHFQARDDTLSRLQSWKALLAVSSKSTGIWSNSWRVNFTSGEYVWMYVCMYVCMHVSVYIYTYIYIYIHSCVRARTCACAPMCSPAPPLKGQG